MRKYKTGYSKSLINDIFLYNAYKITKLRSKLTKNGRIIGNIFGGGFSVLKKYITDDFIIYENLKRKNNLDDKWPTEKIINEKVSDQDIHYMNKMTRGVEMGNTGNAYLRTVNDYSLSGYQIFSVLNNSGDSSCLSSFPDNCFVNCLKSSDKMENINDFIDSLESMINLYLSESSYDLFSRKKLNLFEKIKRDYRFDEDDQYDEDGYGEDDENAKITQKVLIFKNKSESRNDYIIIELIYHSYSISVCGFASSECKKEIETVEKMVEDEFNRFKEENTKPKDSSGKYYIISISNGGGLDLEPMKINKNYFSDSSKILKNYNDDFVDIDNKIKSHIENDDNGLILLHGIPGSGKTSYVKHLISFKKKRKIVYIPPNMINVISMPEFARFSKENLKNSVIIVEDAEPILISRSDIESRKEAVSNLLNLTDGIVGDSLNILIICTFNTGIENIDDALMRKGRLLLQYKFDKLSLDKTNDLTKELYGIYVDKEMTLADIYNLNVDQNIEQGLKSKKMNRVGFI